MQPTPARPCTSPTRPTPPRRFSPLGVRHEGCTPGPARREEVPMIHTGSANVGQTAPAWQDGRATAAGFPAGPAFWSPFGMNQAFRPDPIAYFMATFRTFGDVVGFRPRPFRSILIANPEHIKHVLQDNNHNYVKGV